VDIPSRRFELVPIDDLVDDPRNPKGHDDAALDRSIDVLGRRWQETSGEAPVRSAGASVGPHDFTRPVE